MEKYNTLENKKDFIDFISHKDEYLNELKYILNKDSINFDEDEIKIISELPYCDSCTGVIQQFNEMFPNIKIILVDGVK